MPSVLRSSEAISLIFPFPLKKHFGSQRFLFQNGNQVAPEFPLVCLEACIVLKVLLLWPSDIKKLLPKRHPLQKHFYPHSNIVSHIASFLLLSRQYFL